MMIFLGTGIEDFLVELFKWNGISKRNTPRIFSSIIELFSRISKEALIYFFTKIIREIKISNKPFRDL